MSHTTPRTRTKQSIEAQFALAERVLKGIHQRIDEDLERACDLEVKHALALYRAGKATLRDVDEVIAEARRRIA